MNKIVRILERTTNDDMMSSFKGEVSFFEGDGSGNPINQLCKNHNLIVYESREIILQRLFDFERAPITGVVGDNELKISWISLGTGGADPASPSNPINPTLNDNQLNTEISIDASNLGYASVGGLSGCRKPIGTMEILADSKNVNRYLIMKTTTVISRNEANGNNINEAALWFADHSSDPSAITKFRIAARTTFPTIYKTSALELILVWYWFI